MVPLEGESGLLAVFQRLAHDREVEVPNEVNIAITLTSVLANNYADFQARPTHLLEAVLRNRIITNILLEGFKVTPADLILKTQDESKKLQAKKLVRRNSLQPGIQPLQPSNKLIAIFEKALSYPVARLEPNMEVVDLLNGIYDQEDNKAAKILRKSVQSRILSTPFAFYPTPKVADLEVVAA